MSSAAARAHLCLVPATTEEARPSRWFCGHCAAPADATPPPHARTCASCGVGVLLETDAQLAPRPGEPFAIVDETLTVRALSVAGEQLLAVREHDVVGRPITELLAAADAEATGAQTLATAIALAARGDEAPTRLTVRPLDVFGVRLEMRVGLCGPPRAALLVLE